MSRGGEARGARAGRGAGGGAPARRAAAAAPAPIAGAGPIRRRLERTAARRARSCASCCARASSTSARSSSSSPMAARSRRSRSSRRRASRRSGSQFKDLLGGLMPQQDAQAAAHGAGRARGARQRGGRGASSTWSACASSRSERVEQTGHRLHRRDRQDGRRARRDATGRTCRARACSATCCRSSRARRCRPSTAPVRTDHVLFIAAGAFHSAKPSDLIPELQGRFPIRVELSSLAAGGLRADPDRAAQFAGAPVHRAARAPRASSSSSRTTACGRSPRSRREVNERTDDIGARRLHTVMEKPARAISPSTRPICRISAVVIDEALRPRTARASSCDDRGPLALHPVRCFCLGFHQGEGHEPVRDARPDRRRRASSFARRSTRSLREARLSSRVRADDGADGARARRRSGDRRRRARRARCPDMDGISVLRRLREARPELRGDHARRRTTDQEIVLEALRLGACDYLAKPLHDEELVLAVRPRRSTATRRAPVGDAARADRAPGRAAWSGSRQLVRWAAPAERARRASQGHRRFGGGRRSGRSVRR